MNGDTLYPRFRNPLLGAPERTLPKHVAIVGAGTIGPDVGYYLKSSLPDSTLTLIDVREEALASIRDRFASYAQKGVARRQDEAKRRRLACSRTSSPRPTTTLSRAPTWSSRRPPRTSR